LAGDLPAGSSLRMTEQIDRLLLVEDDPEFCRALSRFLRREQLEVTAAPSCTAARALTCWFDVGVFDIGLVDGNGAELAEQLLAEGRVGKAVFFTAVSRESVLRSTSRLGPVVRKQEGVEALVQVVLGILGRGPMTRSGILVNGKTPEAAEADGSKGRVG
jgi:DNA-binding NarL/FixJ family response regulator